MQQNVERVVAVPRSLLFVCEGNTCRGPMAEALARRKWPNCRILSVGTNVIAGEGAAPEAVTVMDQVGLDIRGHRRTSVKDVNIDNYELIVSLAKRATTDLENIFSIPRNRIKTLHVEDPAATNIEKYAKVRDHIAKGLNALSFAVQST
jgi:protein-tyrosine-phosphatase